MSERYDAAVIGAGPAGALAARQIARLGGSVLLVDKAAFPRDKVCGCCINGAALATLRSVGLGGLCDECGAIALRTLALSAGGRTAQVPLPPGVALSRRRFDAALVREAVRCGVTFRDGCSAALITGGPGPSLRLRTGVRDSQVDAGAVVVADGLGGRFLEGIEAFKARASPTSRMGCGTTIDASMRIEPGVRGGIHMHCGEGGYVGLVRLEDGRTDVAAAFDVEYIRRMGGPGWAAAGVLEASANVDASWLVGASWRGTPALTRRRRCVAAGGIFVVGDAAGYVEPFTGEGIAWALASGAAVADVAWMAARSGWSPHLARAWSRRHARRVRRRQLPCRLIAAGLRHPGLTRAAVAGLTHWPHLVGPVTRRLAAHPTVGTPA